jgi:hypothetical protein
MMEYDLVESGSGAIDANNDGVNGAKVHLALTVVILRRNFK